MTTASDNASSPCPQCGAPGEPGPFCTVCGANVEEAGRVNASFCPECGAADEPGPFCTACGANVAVTPAVSPTPQQTAPSTSTAPASPAPATPTSAPPTGAPQPAKRRRGCCLGCSAMILALLLGCAGVSLFLMLRPSPAEKLLTGTPDRQAAEEIMADMEASGLDTTGVQVTVIPIGDTGGKLAHAIIDMTVDRPTTDDPVNDYLVGLATGDAAEKYAVSRAAIDMVEADGEPAITVTADAASIAAFADGTMSRDDFLGAVDGKLSPLEAATAVIE